MTNTEQSLEQAAREWLRYVAPVNWKTSEKQVKDLTALLTEREAAAYERGILRAGTMVMEYVSANRTTGTVDYHLRQVARILRKAGEGEAE